MLSATEIFHKQWIGYCTKKSKKINKKLRNTKNVQNLKKNVDLSRFSKGRSSQMLIY